MTVALLIAALIVDIALSIIVYTLFREVETLREHEQDTNLELADIRSKNLDSAIIQNTLVNNNDASHNLYVKLEKEVNDLEKRLTASHKYFEIKYSGILGNINNLWTHMDATEKVVLSLSEKTSNTDTSEHKMKEPHYRYRHHYIHNSKPVSPIPDIPDCKEEVNKNDANADSKEEQNIVEDTLYMNNIPYYHYVFDPTRTVSEDNAEVSKDNNFNIEQNTENDAVTIEQVKDDDIPTFNDPSSIKK